MTKSNTSLKHSTTVSHPDTVIQARYRSAIGVDIHLEVLVCCYQYCHDDVIETTHASFASSASDIDRFAQWCQQRQPDIIVMESTGVLWRSAYEALEEVGFDQRQLALVNARDVKAIIGRKTDREDARRLGEIARLGNIKRSMVPPRAFRDMRLLARRYQKITNQMANAINAYHKLLNCVGCRASTVFSDVRGKAAQAILEAKILNAAEFEKVVRENGSRLKHSTEQILDALNFEIADPIRQQLQDESELIDCLQRTANETFKRLAQYQKPYQREIERLSQIPCLDETSARLIFAELCEDLKGYFPDVEHFTSWTGICPGNNISAKKSKDGKSAKGNKWLRRTLIECANTARFRKDAINDRFNAFKLRRGTKRAVVAVAHYLARVIYVLLTKRVEFSENPTSMFRDALIDRVVRSTKQLARQGIEMIGTRAVQRDTGEVIAQPH